MTDKAKNIIFLLVFFSVVSVVSGTIYAVNTETVLISYFYTNICESCREADDTIDYYKELLQNKPDKAKIVIISYNIADSQGLFAYREHLDYYKIDMESISVPVLFAGKMHFTGPDEIEKGLRDIDANGLDDPGFFVYLEADDSRIKRDFSAFRFSGAAITGLINGLNTCALSMFLFLISLLLAKPDIRIGLAGTAFIAGKFAAYFFIGSLFYSVFSKIDMQVYSVVMKVFLAVFAVLMASLNFSDYLKARNENYGKIKNQLPANIRKLNHRLIIKIFDSGSGLILLISSFFAGIIVSVGEFLCTGQLYIATIAYILQTAEQGVTPYIFLALYSFSFIIPAAVILFIIIRTRKTILMSEFLRKKIPAVKLATGILLIAAAGLTIIIL